jgi:prepilin-type N-terminal cleavage/methylation domain-containing protein
MFERFHSDRGFTFIELMVAALILALSSLAMYYMFSQGQVLLMEQDHRRIVFELAQKKLASYKLLSDKELLQEDTETGSEVIARLDDQSDEDENQGLTAEYTVEVERMENAYFQVTIEYTWEERSGRDYQVTLVDNYPLDVDEGP